jgi:hypothetical protein
MSPPIDVNELEQQVKSLQSKIDSAHLVNAIIDLKEKIGGLDPYNDEDLREAVSQINHCARRLNETKTNGQFSNRTRSRRSRSASRPRPWRVINACLKENAGRWLSPAQINDDKPVMNYCRKVDIGLTHIQEELREKTEMGKVECREGKYRYTC